MNITRKCWYGIAGVSVGVALLVIFATSYIHQPISRSPTSVSRLDFLHALAHGTFRIDRYENNTPDKASNAGHFYSDKAPGTVALAALPFMASACALRALGIPLDSDSGWLFSSWIGCAGSIGILTGLGAAALFALLSRRVAPRYALVGTVAIFLGAAPLPYATMMFSHSLVIGLVAIAMWAINQSPECKTRPTRYGALKYFVSNRWDLLAGFACGWALASEYTAGIVLLGLLVWLMSRGKRRAVPFCAAAVPPLLLIPLYSWLCFGNPFSLPYSLNESFPAMKEGLYGIKWPDGRTAFRLLFGPTRGLFFWTPFLLMALLGYRKLFRTDRVLFWLTSAVPLLQLLIVSGRTWDWEAGPTLGPRYLAPMLPLLAVPCALGVQRLPWTGYALAFYSVAITTLATLTNPCPPGQIANPLLELHVPQALRGDFAPNLGKGLGLWPTASVVVFYMALLGGLWWLWRYLPHRAGSEQLTVHWNRHDYTDGEGLRLRAWVYVLFATALLARVALLDFESGYYRTFLSPWYDYITMHGQWQSLPGHVGNYLPLNLYFLLISTLLPLPAVYAVKSISVVGDCVAAWFVWRLLRRRFADSDTPLAGLLVFLFLPTVLMNGAVWGHSDVMFTAAFLGALYWILERKGVAALICFGAAAALSPEAIFLVPFLAMLVATGRLQWKWVWVPAAVYFVAGGPTILAGRPAIDVLLVQAPHALTADPSFGAMNLYQWIPGTASGAAWWIGSILILAGACIFVWLSLRVQSPTDENAWLVCAALFSVLLVPYLLPGMHERCFFPADVLAVVYAFYRPQRWWVACLVQLTSAVTYVPYLTEHKPVLQDELAAAMTVAVFTVGFDLVALSRKDAVVAGGPITLRNSAGVTPGPAEPT